MLSNLSFSVVPSWHSIIYPYGFVVRFRIVTFSFLIFLAYLLIKTKSYPSSIKSFLAFEILIVPIAFLLYYPPIIIWKNEIKIEEAAQLASFQNSFWVFFIGYL